MGPLARLRQLRARLMYRLYPPPPTVSTEYQILEAPTADPDDGWQTLSVAESQHRAFAPLLEEARRGRPRVDFEVAARAVEATGLARPSVLEVGCGSGYYSEVFRILLPRPVDYVGLDYSSSMLALARRAYPGERFLRGDACALPLRDDSFDVVLSGASLMHIVEFDRAIDESVRVSRRWCVFHTVPLLDRRGTTLLRKRAYGEPVVEVVFNRGELERGFAARGLEIARVYESIPYDLAASVGERTYTLTYLCQKTS